MKPQSHSPRCDRNDRDQQRDEDFRHMARIENAYYDGDVDYPEYSRVITRMLKDPVSLGIVGGNSNRGHQR